VTFIIIKIWKLYRNFYCYTCSTASSKSSETVVDVEPHEEIAGRLDYSIPLASKSANPVCGLKKKLNPATLNGPINSSSETRVVETGVFASAPWPDLKGMSYTAGNQEPRPVMVRESEFATLTGGTPDFIAPTVRPANSLYLSPVDYRIWEKLQECVHRSRIPKRRTAGSRLIEEWNISTRWLSVKQSGSSVHVFKLAFEHVENILNTDFKYV